MNELKPEDVYKWLDELANNENLKQCSGIPSTAEAALALLREKDKEIERLQCQVNRLRRYDEERDIRLHERLTETARAEAVDDVKLALAVHFGTYTDKDTVPIKEVFCLLDKIAKKLKGEKE